MKNGMYKECRNSKVIKEQYEKHEKFVGWRFFIFFPKRKKGEEGLW